MSRQVYANGVLVEQRIADAAIELARFVRDQP